MKQELSNDQGQNSPQPQSVQPADSRKTLPLPEGPHGEEEELLSSELVMYIFVYLFVYLFTKLVISLFKFIKSWSVTKKHFTAALQCNSGM